MHSHEWGRRAVPITTCKRQIFSRRKKTKSKPLLVASTLIVGLALVFAVGFKFGRKFHDQYDSTATGQLAAQVAKPISLNTGAVGE